MAKKKTGKVPTKKAKEAAPPKKAKKKWAHAEGGGLKEFAIQHLEKAVFGLCVVLCLFMIWNGFRHRQGIEPTKTPVALDSEVSTTTRMVNEYSWDRNFRAERTSDNKDFQSRAEKALRSLNADQYATNQYLRPPVSPPRTKRSDPKLLKALELVARPGFGLMDMSAAQQTRDGRPRDGQDQPIFTTDSLEDELLDDPKKARDIPSMSNLSERRGASTGDMRSVYFVSVMALVPLREQFIEYQSRLMNSRGQDPERDVPRYVDWHLERSEVDNRGKAVGFQRIASGRTRGSDRNEAGGRGDVRASRFDDGPNDGQGENASLHHKFRDARLTSEVPPVTVRDYATLFVHQRIAELSRLEFQRASELRNDRPERDDDDRGGQVDDRRPRDDRNRRRRGPDGDGPGSFDSGSFLSASMPPDRVPEYYMFRYVDTTVEQGKSYQYRLQLVLADPNEGLPDETLENDVVIRKRNSQTRGERQTSMSAASKPVRIRRGQQVVMGKADAVPKVVNRENGQTYRRPLSNPTAQVMGLLFDAARATDIPATLSASPGTAVDFEGTVEVPLWNKGKLVKEEHAIKTDFMILDIRGGEVSDVKAVANPGEALVWDRSGKIFVISEISDESLFTKFTFPPEDPAAGRSRREGDVGIDGDRGGREPRGRPR